MEKESDYVLLQSQTIDWLRFPLAVAVVFIHSFGYPLTYTLPALNIHSFSGMDVYNVIDVYKRQDIAIICLIYFRQVR